MNVTTERIEKAVEQATLAYWAEVVKHFPEVETGDFSPEDSHAQDTANTQAVNSWLMMNVTTERIGKAAEEATLAFGAAFGGTTPLTSVAVI